MEVTLTHYKNASVRDRAATGRQVTLPWTALGAYLEGQTTSTRAKASAGYWVAAPCSGFHSDANCAPTSVVALDWDDPGPPDWVALEGLAYVAHTTDSHTEAVPRWRVWLVLDREYSADEIRRARLPESWVGAHLRSISQPVYVPTMGEDTWWVEAPADSRPHVLELAPAEAPPAPAPSAPSGGARLSPSQAATNALVTRWLSNPDGTNRLAGATGACLADWGWADGGIVAYLAHWLRADPKLAKHTDDALRGAAKRRVGDRIVGFPVLAEELGVGVWAPERPEGLDLSALLLEEAPAVAKAGAAPVRLGSTEPPFHWATGDEMLDYDLPDVPWLVEALSFAPGAPGLCTGYSGTGKTTTLQDLALAVATPGRRFLNHYQVRHGAVAHIDLEQGTQQTIRTYRALGLERGADLVCSVLPSWKLTDPDSVKALVLAARGRALIIIDSFRVACLGVDENSSDFAEPLGVLGQISEATGCAFMLNHHSGKGHQDTPHMSARGSSAITAAVSVHWSFERKPLTPETRPCLQLVKSRNHQTPAMVWQSWVEKVDLGGSDGQFQLWARADAGAPAEDVELDASILDAVRDGSIRNIAELASTVQRQRAKVGAAAKRLGIVNRKGILIIPE